MVEAMKKVAGMDVELTVEERNLLSVAYKNVIGKFYIFQFNSLIVQLNDNKYLGSTAVHGKILLVTNIAKNL